MSIRTIQPSKDEKARIRVAAYCRVSTDLEEQESSYEAQVEHYYRYILTHTEWEYGGIYTDEGISGTGTAKREGFNRMIRDCKNGDIDLILTKSISRFARNTLDCLRYIRMLKELGIAVYFEKESINTMDAKGEVLISIMASLAQQESQSISENIRMGIHYQFQQGKVRINHTCFLGYTKDQNGHLVIVEEEAAIVRRIYQEFLQGKSYNEIARGLTNDQIPTPSGKERWYLTTVKSILQNEKYKGDLLLQKYYTADFLTKKKVVNDGAKEQYYIEDDHDPIISKEIFNQVQQEIGVRNTRREEVKARQTTTYALTGLITCSVCGSHYYRIHMNGQNKHTTWRCKNRVKTRKRCRGPILTEEQIHAAILMALDLKLQQYKTFKKRLRTMQNDTIPVLEEEKEVISDMLNTLKEDMALVQSVNVQLIERFESTKKRNRDLENKLQQCRTEAEQLHLFISYLDYYTKNKKKGSGLEDWYDDEMVHMILREIIVYPGYLLIRFCTGDPQMIPLKAWERFYPDAKW